MERDKQQRGPNYRSGGRQWRGWWWETDNLWRVIQSVFQLWAAIGLDDLGVLMREWERGYELTALLEVWSSIGIIDGVMKSTDSDNN